jgi:hypothetical protein
VLIRELWLFFDELRVFFDQRRLERAAAELLAKQRLGIRPKPAIGAGHSYQFCLGHIGEPLPNALVFLRGH